MIGPQADEAEFRTIAEQDWVRASLEGLKPVRAGRFLIHGSHDREVRRTNDLAIEIEAALAFGTGHHGTTLGCLRALVAERKRRRPRHVLDVGTGTGILAFAAAKDLRQPVVAGDLDVEAVITARENARLNGLGPWLKLYHAAGTRHRMPTAAAISISSSPTSSPSPANAGPSLSRVVAEGGTLVLSGLIERDVPGVLSAYRHQGFALSKRGVIEGWVHLVLRRGGAAPRETLNPPGEVSSSQRGHDRTRARRADPDDVLTSVARGWPRAIGSRHDRARRRFRFRRSWPPQGARADRRPPRRLREAGVDGFVVPRADEHQSEYVPDNAERLAWLTGFTGSAGTAVILADSAALVVDGR